MKQTRLTALYLIIALVGAAIFGLAQTVLAQETGSNWQGYYWNNTNHSGTPNLARVDPVLNFNWRFDSPAPGVINPDNFSARWYLAHTFVAGTYRFRGGADDGIRIAVDGVKVIDRFSAGGGFVVNTVDVVLTAGQHTIIVDYLEVGGEAGILVDWTNLAGETGSVPGSTTVPLTPFPTATPVPPPVRAVIIADIVNVRSAPSTDSDIVQVVYKDDDFKVVAQNGANTWFLLDLGGGRTGWVWRTGLIYLYNGDHTKLPTVTVAVQPAPGPQTVEGYARYMIFVRSLPSTRNSEKLGVINAGEYFKIIKRYSRNRAWVFVDHNGLQGWVFVPNIRVVQGQIGLLPIGE